MTEDTNQYYYEDVGRRKTAVARVRLYPAQDQTYRINERELEDYFPTAELRTRVTEPFTSAGITQQFAVSVLLHGGGIHSQAEALRHGIARALIKYDAELRPALKQAGYLKRDPRTKERKKFGLKKARKSAQWSKR